MFGFRVVGPWLGVASLAFALASRAHAQDQASKEPDRVALVKAGEATLKRMQKQACAWTTTVAMPGNIQAFVEVIQTPDMARYRLSLVAQGKRAGVFQLITRDGLWYADEGHRAGKYRPYEVPFELPNAYYILTCAQLNCVAHADRLGEFESTEGGVATYRTAPPEALKRQLLNALREFEKLKKQSDPKAIPPEVVEVMERSRDVIERGVPLKVDIATGAIVQHGTADRLVRVNDFGWVDRTPREEFKVEGKDWNDMSDDPTAGGDLGELLMIAHNAAWRPGMKSPATDSRLVDLRNGRIRRIAFQGAEAIPGCWLRDRSRVIVSGADVIEGVVGLFEVDLKTGKNRQLGGDLLANGFTMMPALSPDGKTLAVLHKGAGERSVLDSRVCLVDIETGAAKPLGAAGDMAYLSWLPDGEGLVLLRRERTKPGDLTSETIGTISRMDLTGKVTKIREGARPVLLADGKTILFQDLKAGIWQTCDTNGENAKPYAGGLADYGFPAPAPDGRRILMMHFKAGKAPVPMILKIGESRGEPAIDEPGLWATPAWR